MGTVKLKSSDEVFQLKISLLGSDPEIWRTIQISSAATLSTLHKAIQSAFDWEDSHLHEFTTIKHEKINKRQNLKEVLRVGKKIIYTYDFGDCWDHLITVESRQSPDLNKKYPCCIDGATGYTEFYSGGWVKGNIAVTANVWTHCAWVFGASSSQMYVNGVEAYNGAATLADISGALNIGRRADGGHGP